MSARARLRRIAAAAGVLVLVQALAVGLYWAVERRRDAERPGRPFAYERLDGTRPVPDAAFERPDGTSLHPGALRGRPVLLHFWATWCAPCRAELPRLLELGRELEEAGGLQLVAVSVDESWEVVRAFFGGEVPPGVVRAGSPAVQRRFGVSTLPDTFLVEEDGTMALRFTGARDWRAPEARALLMERERPGP
ncbi:thiol:disulfide interchange protein tlpA [Sorangium cellulosum]|uniref:Thiol:disulfide interchange protein tlpA n=1 Tax=Sorangium cellulosum TaxID=56 RepID=A0A4P2QC87_SORCE|nr:TlpA disulfide reductase family protein [Sorangium cellulosum]AUX26926.1 thiol:disulfide interchange protein tlpA [Sorangium cellulosum]